jgi:hypothetical protein
MTVFLEKYNKLQGNLFCHHETLDYESYHTSKTAEGGYYNVKRSTLEQYHINKIGTPFKVTLRI